MNIHLALVVLYILIAESPQILLFSVLSIHACCWHACSEEENTGHHLLKSIMSADL
jgi:hypothetical protein